MVPPAPNMPLAGGTSDLPSLTPRPKGSLAQRRGGAGLKGRESLQWPRAGRASRQGCGGFARPRGAAGAEDQTAAGEACARAGAVRPAASRACIKDKNSSNRARELDGCPLGRDSPAAGPSGEGARPGLTGEEDGPCETATLTLALDAGAGGGGGEGKQAALRQYRRLRPE